MAKQGVSVLAVAAKPRFFYGYVVVMGAAGIQLVAWGIFNTYGVFFKPLLTEFGWSRAAISGAASVSMFILGFLGIIAGGLNDRFGPRIVMTACGFIFGAGYILMSQVSALWQLYLFYGVIIGIGASSVDVISLSTVARWFTRKRGRMSGVVKAGAGIGMMMMPLVAGALILALGWRNSYLVLGALGLVSLISVTQLLRRDPAQMEQLPDGAKKTDGGDVNRLPEGLAYREVVRTRQFWLVCTAYLLTVFCTYTILVHIAPHAMDLGISVTSAASILALIGGVSTAGRLVMGGAGDRIGNKSALLICFGVLAVSLFWLLLAKELWMFYLFAVIYGFAHGGFFAVVSPIVAEMFGTRAHGVILGAVNFSGTIGGAIGPVLAGYIFDINHNYQVTFLLLAVFSVTGLVLAALLRPVGLVGLVGLVGEGDSR
ncbi:MAG: MFS transporter [Dehalococcoidales bacterium]|nr:MFS transporter [Dehalococcoidales bacterium]MDZ4230226.1 MFS transporter [Dehalococcoidales bacterium]